ncbi:MAG: EAL domain-containing protein [Nitrosomonadales bacterium]|nr:EAL domain-containing protein [Nitrosomonadales bacterium]
MQQADKQGLLWLHPDYRDTMRTMAKFLVALTLIQLLAWLTPASPDAKGIPNYLPLHTLFETVSIVISMLVFAVGWNSHSRDISGNTVLLACVFFAVGWLDFSHTVSYVGMPEFVSPNDSEKHLNFWLSARFLASVSLLIVAIRSWHLHSSTTMRYMTLGALVLVTALVNWLVLFHQTWLPHTFIPGQGLTPLKKNCEYLIIAINLATAVLLWQKMRKPQPFAVAPLFGAVCIMAMSEFFFTLYTTMTGSYNVLGHIYKAIAYLFVYRAIVVETIEEPYNKLKQAQQNLALSLQASNTGLWNWDLRTDHVYYSPEWKAQLGYLPDDLPNQLSTWESLLHPEDRVPAMERARSFIATPKQNYENEFRLRHQDGHYRWMMVRGEKQYDADGRPSRLIGSQIDISERKLAEQRIQQLANFDMLTGLPNRLLFKDRVEQTISAAQRDHSQLAVLFFDLDHFKNINDTLGHPLGDELLIEVGKRLQSCVRDMDTVSRMGGDEFILLLPGSDASGVTHVAIKLLAAIAEPYRIEHNELVVTLSIGIAMYPEDGEDFDTLYRHADTAMYKAKQDGRNNYRFFTQEMQSRTLRILQIENALRQAIDHGQFYLHYQPLLAIADGRIVGVEALLRWQHPELGIVSPGEFIPIAEKSGQIVKIGEWVLRNAVQQLKTWLDDGLPPMIVAVNLSAVQFRHPDLPGSVSHILAEAQVPPQYLELELTEGVAMDNPQIAIAIMDDLHARGVLISIDDFGTGYSSLNYLKKFKVYKLKIDQSFVRDINSDEDDKAIVGAIIQMSRSLGFLTIAEGVETAEQLAFLRECGCDEVQGYYFSKPLPAKQLEEFVHRHPALATVT